METFKNKFIEYFLEYFFILLGTTMLAFSIIKFYNPNNLIVGGVSGIGIMLYNYSINNLPFIIPISLTNLIINIPLFIAGYFLIGKNFLGRTIFATFYLSVALSIMNFLPDIKTDMMLGSIYGGVFAGIGIGLVMKGLATTGGVDLAATIINKYKNHFSISSIMFVFDFIVISVGVYMFGIEMAMYAVLSVFISSKCINFVVEGMNIYKAVLIISDKSDEISDQIIKNINRGVTALNGRGVYTNTPKDVLLCVFSPKDLTKIKKLISNVDNKAFVVLTDYKEVLGEGFNNM